MHFWILYDDWREREILNALWHPIEYLHGVNYVIVVFLSIPRYHQMAANQFCLHGSLLETK